MNEILYFGCKDRVGHSLHSKINPRIGYCDQPWRNLDGGLLSEIKTGQRQGAIYHARKDGWSVISFWDRSVDSRQNSNSAFLVRADLSASEIIRLAREQWPEIFSRPCFPTLF